MAFKLAQWQWDVANMVADVFGCACYMLGKTMMFYGLGNRAEIAAYAFEVVYRQITAARRNFLKTCRARKPAHRRYLYEIVSKWQPSAAAAVPACPMPADAAAVNTKLRQGVHALTQWAGEDWLKQEIAAGFSLLAAQNLKGRPAAQDLPVLAALWEQRLMDHAVARGEVKLIAETDRMRIQTAFKRQSSLD